MKTKIPKARVMWANYYSGALLGGIVPVIHAKKSRAEQAAAGCTKPVRVAVIPLDEVEAVVERSARALYLRGGADAWYKESSKYKEAYLNAARAALHAAGIPCKRKARK